MRVAHLWIGMLIGAAIGIVDSQQMIAQTNQGIIEGAALSPPDYKPALGVCAQSTSNSYLMTCINSPESQTTFTTSSLSDSARTTPSLNPGVYNRVSNFVVIYEYNGRFCYGGGSKNGTLLASMSEHPERRNEYFLDAFGNDGTSIFQIDQRTVSYGGSEYEWYGDVPTRFEDMQSDVQACLTSQSAYYEVEEPGTRQRPR